MTLLKSIFCCNFLLEQRTRTIGILSHCIVDRKYLSVEKPQGKVTNLKAWDQSVT